VDVRGPPCRSAATRTSGFLTSDLMDDHATMSPHEANSAKWNLGYADGHAPASRARSSTRTSPLRALDASQDWQMYRRLRPCGASRGGRQDSLLTGDVVTLNRPPTASAPYSTGRSLRFSGPAGLLVGGRRPARSSSEMTWRTASIRLRGP